MEEGELNGLVPPSRRRAEPYEVLRILECHNRRVTSAEGLCGALVKGRTLSATAHATQGTDRVWRENGRDRLVKGCALG